MADFAVVGHSVYRKDANQKVTGQVLHVGNIEMPGMLHVAVLRSPYAHARITRIDKSRAEALKGVAIVLTGADIAKMPGVDPHFGPAFRDQNGCSNSNRSYSIGMSPPWSGAWRKMRCN